MPSSLTRVSSITSVFSTCPPVSVLVRARVSFLEAFLGGLASGTRRLIASWHRTSGYAASDLPETTPTCLPQVNHRLGSLSLPRPPFGQVETTWYRNINLLAIGYAFRPRLRSRLTLGGLTFPRKPCAFGGGASHPSDRYSFRHSHSPSLHGSLPVPLHCRRRRSPTIRRSGGSATAARRLSPRHFRRGMARPVSCYALLK